MVFHIPATIGEALGPVLFKLCKDLFESFSDRVVQDIESAPMSHPKDDLFNPEIRERFDHVIQHRDQGFRPLKRESLFARVAFAEDLLEGF